MKAFTLPVVCSLWTSDAKTDCGVAVLCYVSYYEGGRKNQFKCLIPTEDSFRWVTHHALRNFRAFGGDDLPAYVEDWMKEWETSSAPRYGRGITKQEVNVDADSSDSDATPFAQRKRGQPSDLKGKGPKKPKPERKKGGTPAAGRQQAAAAGSVPGSAGPVTLSATSVHNIVGALTEDFASGVLANVKDAVTSQATSVVAGALREERRSEVAARLKRQEEKTKKMEDKLELALAEQARLREAKEKAEATAKETQDKLTTSSAEVARLRSERDSLRERVESLGVDKANLQDTLNAALGTHSPRATASELTTPRKQPRPSTSWPASPSQPPFSQE